MKQKPPIDIETLTAQELSDAYYGGKGWHIPTRHIINELIRRAKEWEEFKSRIKNRFTTEYIVLKEMQNENQKD